MVSQSPKFSPALFMYLSDFEHKTEVPKAGKLHFGTLNVPRMQEMDLQGSKVLESGRGLWGGRGLGLRGGGGRNRVLLGWCPTS